MLRYKIGYGHCSCLIAGLLVLQLADLSHAHAQDAPLAPIGRSISSNCATTKALSTNFTLVNLNNGANTVTINYYKPDGTPSRPSESTTLATQGAQAILRQYDDAGLSAGSGSAVAGASGPLGAVVQIQARDQVPSNGAFTRVSDGGASVNVPLVAKNGSSADGVVNSDLIVQNTGSGATTFTISFVNANGVTVHTTPPRRSTTVQH
jgi:hypothetical protein